MNRPEIGPVSQRVARQFVEDHHRHNKAPRGDIFRVGLFRSSELVGVGMAGRPVARLADDGQTIEVLRVCLVDGVPNGCSLIYGSLRRAAKALGWQRTASRCGTPKRTRATARKAARADATTATAGHEV